MRASECVGVRVRRIGDVDGDGKVLRVRVRESLGECHAQDLATASV